jgi:L-ribulose-5-phosphate 3-epimerase UlaE
MVLALENVDCERVDSVEKAMHYVKKINSPWFQVYPDLGNMTAAGYDPLEQLPLSEGHLVGVHVKDVRKGELRGVPLGKGIVRFQEAFRLLSRMGFAGPLVMEMWAQYDTTGDPIKAARQARATLAGWISETLVGLQPAN